MQNEKELNNFKQRFLECDKKFDSVFSLTSAASKVINSDLTILKVNKALTDLLGYTAEEIEGTKILEYACEDHKAHWHHLQEELWARQVPFFKLRACLYRKDRKIVWVDVTTILYQDMGETLGFTVLDDITALKDFEQSQKRLSLALRYSGTAVWELDLKNKTVFRSENHDELFGYLHQRQNWTLGSYYSHITPEDLPKFKTAIEQIATNRVLDLQLRLETAENFTKWINFKGKTEQDDNGQPVKVVGVITDITKDKQIEHHKDDFISIASHELRTPVTSLKAAAQLLDRMKDDLPDPVITMISQANKSINRISVLIDDLLNAGKLYQNALQLKKTGFNLYQLAQDCCDKMISAAHHVSLSGNEEVLVDADAERIERVIFNLLSNAIKYAAHSPEIKVVIENNESTAKVSVVDQGPGIAIKKQPYLFDRYSQAPSGLVQNSGLGLGLFISAEIIRKHGGDIGVQSEPGVGSTFWFTLPMSSSTT